MGQDQITPRVTFFFVLGWAITILLFKSGVSLWNQDHERGLIYLAIGLVLLFIFFRKRLFAFFVIGLGFIFVNAGLNALFHPKPASILVTAASAAGFVIVCVWHTRRHPELQGTDWRKVFDNPQK